MEIGKSKRRPKWSYKMRQEEIPKTIEENDLGVVIQPEEAQTLLTTCEDDEREMKARKNHAVGRCWRVVERLVRHQQQTLRGKCCRHRKWVTADFPAVQFSHK